jgi:hypothetical protein
MDRTGKVYSFDSRGDRACSDGVFDLTVAPAAIHMSNDKAQLSNEGFRPVSNKICI